MKKAGLFAKIIYYVFTFLIGILLALTLPNAFLELVESPQFVVDSLEQGDLYSVMILTGNYFNKTPVCDVRFEEGGGIFLFEAVMPVRTEAEQELLHLESYALYKTYLGYIYGVQDSYDTYRTKTNDTKMLVNSSQEVQLLDSDVDGDGTLDACATARDYGFIYFSIAEIDVGSSIRSIELIDASGDTFKSLDVNLDFSTSQFFVTVSSYVTEYNDLLHQYNEAKTESERNSLDRQLENKYYSFKSEFTQNENYVVVDKDNEEYQATKALIAKPANVKASVVIVAYFVLIYIIGDFLLGSHYIIKFFRWFIYDVCKAKPKDRKKLKKSEVFGHDYYSSVTMSLDLTDLPDFNESVQVKYTNTDVEIVFILLKENNYTATERIKAGTYVNPFIDMNRQYAPVDLPDNLEVEGYKMDVKIKIIRREV
ncbi:MAG: hypothetical protein J1F65_01875 [Clostridiales bacterium]|nr:hypothetical protein [Clostridiales bacterium]